MKLITVTRVLCNSFVIFYAFVACAQESGTNDENIIGSPATKLERVEVRARPQSDTDLRRRSSIAKIIYGREELDKYADVSVLEVLKRLPGITIAEGQPRLRGFGGGYTQILVNGEVMPPGFSFDQLNPTQVERVEVLKAPMPELSTQAIAGTINIILREPAKIAQREGQIRLGFNVERPTVSFNTTWNEKILGRGSLFVPISAFEWRAANTIQETSLMKGLDDILAEGIQEFHTKNWGKGFNATPRIAFQFPDDKSLTLQAFIQGNRWNFSRTQNNQTIVLGEPIFGDDTRAKGISRTGRITFTYANRIDNDSRLELRLSTQAITSRYDNRTYQSSYERIANIGSSQSLSLTHTAKYSHFIGEKHKATVGWDVEWRKQEETRTTTFDGAPTLTNYDGQFLRTVFSRQAFYLQDEWTPTQSMEVLFGLRAEQFETKTENFDSTFTRGVNHIVTPIGHLTLKLDPNGKQLIRTSYTRSFKNPTIDAMNTRPWISAKFPDLNHINDPLSPDRVGNPGLLSELATGIDIAYERYLSDSGVLSLGIFYRDVKNLIRNQTRLQNVNWATAPRWVSTPENVSHARTTGMELEAKMKANQILPIAVDVLEPLNIRASLNIYSSRVAGIRGPNNRLNSQPPWASTLSVDYRIRNLFPWPIFLGGNLNYIPSFTMQQSENEYFRFGKTRNIDLYVRTQIQQNINVRFVLQNFRPSNTESHIVRTNGTYSSIQSYYRPWYGLIFDIKI